MKWMFTKLFLVMLVAGCAARPIELQQDYQSVRGKLSGSPQATYLLIDQSGKVISPAMIEGQQLVFWLPPDLPEQQCFSLQSSEQQQALSDPAWFKLSVVTKYRELSSTQLSLSHQLQSAVADEQRFRQIHAGTMQALGQHPAFANNSCIVPPQQALPAEPYTKCQSEQECRSEGGAICFSLLLGSEGCGIAAQQLQIPGLLSNPGCSAMAAELAGEKYELDQAVVDAIAGYADDIAHEMIQSESWLEQAFGILLKGAGYAVKLENARQCTDNFVQQHFGPKLLWQAQIRQITDAPQRLYSECQQFVHSTYQSVAAIESAMAQQQQLQPQLSVIHEQLTALEQLQQPVEFCPGG